MFINYCNHLIDFLQTIQVTREMIRYLTSKRLTKKDLTSDEDGTPSRWRFTTRIVTSNKEVDAINLSQLIRFAKDNNKPVFFWYVETANSSGNDTHIKSSTEEIAASVRGMIQYFVEGAPCMVTKNTYMKHGVANGTRGTMHSMTWENDRDFPGNLHNCIPGELVQVQQPYSVNVCIPSKSANEFSTRNDDGKFSMIVPIVREAVSFTVVKYNRKTRKRGVTLRCYSHNVAPTFAMTFHKSQGQTLDRVVLHLHRHEGRALKNLQFEALYVALSRVEFGSHMRVVYDDETGLHHLSNLRRPRNFDLWINNYCEKTGKWKQHGMEQLRKKKLHAALDELRRTKNLQRMTKKKLVHLARVLDVQVNKSVNGGAANKQQYINALYDSWSKQRGNKSITVQTATKCQTSNTKKIKMSQLRSPKKFRSKVPITPEKIHGFTRPTITTPVKVCVTTGSPCDTSEVTIRKTQKRTFKKRLFPQAKTTQLSTMCLQKYRGNHNLVWTKVHGDGFCWLYAFLIATGVLSRTDFPNGDDGRRAPTDRAIKVSRVVAPYAFTDSICNFPEFKDGVLQRMGTYGGYCHYKNILNRMRPGFRFFVLDTTRKWIDCAIIVRQEKIHHTGRRIEQSVPGEMKITDFCTCTQHFSNLLCYEYWPTDTVSRVKMVFGQTSLRSNGRWVAYRNTDVVVCWVNNNHFNAVARVGPVDETVNTFLWTAVNDATNMSTLFPR